MSLIVISVDRAKLPQHTQEEFEEWVKYSIRELLSLELTNPLSHLDLEGKLKEIG